MRLLACLALFCPLLSGCCSGPSYMLLAYDERMELERMERFAIVMPVLDSERAWAFGAPREWIEAREVDYRPLPAQGEERGHVLDGSEAPELLRRAFKATREGLLALGYSPGKAGDDPKEAFFVSLALSYDDSGGLLRLGLHAGSHLETRFDPYRISLAAVVSQEEDRCEVSVEDLVEALLGAIPPREEPEPERDP